MEVIINNKSEFLTKGTSLQSLLEKQDLLEQKGIAIAVNDEVVPKAEWNSRILLANDKITVIKATQGG
jgi:sulfur carrier protein